MSARVGVILSGCGVFDGAEIHETCCILVALDRRGAAVTCVAPNMPQAKVINHLSQKPVAGQQRNMLEESARIARGKIRDLASVSASDFDALMFPGGYGVTMNLSNFAEKGAQATVLPALAKLMREVHAAGRPIGLACIAPVLAARVFGEDKLHPRLTVGSDPAVASAINQMGGQHQNVGPTEVLVDEQNKLVSTPCYMNDVGPWTISQGAERMVEEVLRLTGDVASVVRAHMATMENKF
jgi:enhancing lycopene biosynthesis protein 2